MRLTPNLAAERIANPHAVVVLPIIEIFRMYPCAAQQAGGGQNRRIVIANLMPSA